VSTAKRKRAARTRKSTRHNFLVKLMRPIFQTAVVSVQAETEAEAVTAARVHAMRLREKAWLGAFDGISYAYDVQVVLNTDELREAHPEAEQTDELLVARLMSPQDFHYVLAKADIEAGEGGVLRQPWLRRISALMLADLAGDWLADLHVIEEEGLEKGYRRRGRRNEPAITSKDTGKIIPFRLPEDEDDDSE
jgi:hypothetical protein